MMLNENINPINFNMVMGNPPYQLDNNGSKIPLWPDFIYLGSKVGEDTTLIHPGRWLNPSVTLEKVNYGITTKTGMKEFEYYESDETFPSCDITGGITITNYKKGYKGAIKHNEGNKILYNNKYLLDEFEEEIIQKIDKNVYKKNMLARILPPTIKFDKKQYAKDLQDTPDGILHPIRIWCSKEFGQGSLMAWYYIDRYKIRNIKDNYLVRKVQISIYGGELASSKNQAPIINNNIDIVLDKNTIGSCFFCVPENDTFYDLKLIQSLFCTKTARFLMSITQKNFHVKGFENIPDYLYFKEELENLSKKSEEEQENLIKNRYNIYVDENGERKFIFSDQYFYDKFKFSANLINHIESKLCSKTITEEVI